MNATFRKQESGFNHYNISELQHQNLKWLKPWIQNRRAALDLWQGDCPSPFTRTDGLSKLASLEGLGGQFKHRPLETWFQSGFRWFTWFSLAFTGNLLFLAPGSVGWVVDLCPKLWGGSF